MHFVSWAFFVLLAISLLLRWTIGRRGNETPYLAGLLVLSLIFYGWHIPWYLSLIVFSTLVDYFVGKRLETTEDPNSRQLLVGISVVANLGLLGVFKYYNFGIDAIQDLTGRNLGYSGLALPMGISFYTFQSMSYTIDIYRRQLKPVKSFWRFFLFVSFFPQLVAGPIVRAKEFLYQLERKRRLHWSVVSEGLFLIVQGFFYKVVIADNLGNAVYWNWGEVGVSDESSSLLALSLALFFSAQIYCDFMGYSRIARGIGYLLGFKIPKNFNSPYIAQSFSEFWQRWHMTLSRWLRDYLYISLGGNKTGKLKTYRNLILTMLLGGLWHGANYTYIVWGGIHGLALALERYFGFRKIQSTLGRVTWFVVVQFVVLIGWVYFRSDNLPSANRFVAELFKFDFSSSKDLSFYYILLIPVVFDHIRGFGRENWKWSELQGWEKAGLSGAMSYLILTYYGASSEFIYFQF